MNFKNFILHADNESGGLVYTPAFSRKHGVNVNVVTFLIESSYRRNTESIACVIQSHNQEEKQIQLKLKRKGYPIKVLVRYIYCIRSNILFTYILKELYYSIIIFTDNVELNLANQYIEEYGHAANNDRILSLIHEQIGPRIQKHPPKYKDQSFIKKKRNEY